MIDFSKILKKNNVSSVLGLALDGNRLEAVVVKRLNGQLQIQQTLVTPLALSLLTGDPELIGREIRNHLDKAGIREKRCVLSLPLNLVLTLQAKVPDLPEADVASLLAMEAERGFHSGPENLFVAESRAKSTGGERFATLMAVQRGNLASLEKALRAAQLKPINFFIGVTALESGTLQTGEGVLMLAPAANSFELAVTGGGGVIALRSLDSAMEGEGAQKEIDSDLVAREIRITLGQLPTPFGDTVRRVKIFSRGETSRQFVGEITPKLEAMGLKVELMQRASAAEFDKPVPAEIALSPALALAALRVRGVAPGADFLPPKVHPWKQMFSSKFSSRKLAWAGGAAGLIVLGVVVAFLIQQFQISSLETKWKSMEPRVTELQTAQQQIRKYRPWFDETFRGMRIMKALAEAFPEQGSVTAKTVEIRDLTSVTVSGSARDNQSYLRLLEQLRKMEEISQLKTDSIRGQAPLQFTFNFQWEGAATSGN